MMWLAATGLKEGPLFRLVNPITGVIEGNMEEAKYMNYIKQVFIAAGLPKCSTHTFRVSGCAMLARVGVAAPFRRAAGRWKTGQSWGRYAQYGIVKAQEYIGSNIVDPIFKFWTMKCPVLTAIIYDDEDNQDA